MKLRIATPMYGGLCCSNYRNSLVEVQEGLGKLGVAHTYSVLDNESLVPRGRNKLVIPFELSDETHLMFWDGDIGITHFEDLQNLLAYAEKPEHEVIGGIYPKKQINWMALRQAVINNPNITEEQMVAAAGHFVFNMPKTTVKGLSGKVPWEVLEVGTGLMVIQRGVFEKFKQAYPEQWYKPVDGDTGGAKVERIWDYFANGIYDSEAYGGKCYLSEDYAFCQMCGHMGVKVWMAPWMRTTHRGSHDYYGDFLAAARTQQRGKGVERVEAK